MPNCLPLFTLWRVTVRYAVYYITHKTFNYGKSHESMDGLQKKTHYKTHKWYIYFLDLILEY